MNVQNVGGPRGPIGLQPPGHARAHGASKRAEALAQAPSPTEPAHDGEKVPGVIRLLEAGHFQGVADVRLRINFFDELSARNAETTSTVAADEMNGLLETLDANLGELPLGEEVDEETQAAIGELRASFEEAARAAAEEFASNGAADTDALRAAVEGAFADFLGGLTQLLTEPPTEPAEPGPESEPPDEEETPPEELAELPPGDPANLVVGLTQLLGPPPVQQWDPGPEPPDEEDTPPEELAEVPPGDPAPAAPAGNDQPPATEPNVPPADSGTEPPADMEGPPADGSDGVSEPDSTDPIEEAIAAMAAAMRDAIGAMTESIATASILPDPSPPSGNGGAYDKFLAIYNDLRGISPALDIVA